MTSQKNHQTGSTALIQETELVFINSSRPRLAGPAAHVIKRRGDYYIPPRSPPSPTLYRRNQIPPISGSRAARHKRDYISAKVSEVEAVKPLVLDVHLNGKESQLTTASKTMDLAKAPTFIPSEDHASAFSQLRSLDLLPAQGLADDEFWNLFSRCGLCQNFVTTRTIPYHKCPTSDIGTEVDKNTVKTMYFLWLLDAHNVGRAAMGVPENIFKEIFYTCAECGRYMTQRVAFSHHEDDWDDFSSKRSPPCLYLRSEKGLEDTFWVH